MGAIIFRRIPTRVIILVTAVMLFGGLELAGLLIDSTDEAELDMFRNAPVILFLGVGIIVYILEAMLFTVIPIELSHKFTRTSWFGAMIGIILYGPLYHGSDGLLSILISSWIILVLNSSYIILRLQSRQVAIISTTGFKILFIFYAAFSIYSEVS
jgi:hypothetical protein